MLRPLGLLADARSLEEDRDDDRELSEAAPRLRGADFEDDEPDREPELAAVRPPDEERLPALADLRLVEEDFPDDEVERPDVFDDVFFIRLFGLTIGFLLAGI